MRGSYQSALPPCIVLLLVLLNMTQTTVVYSTEEVHRQTSRGIVVDTCYSEIDEQTFRLLFKTRGNSRTYGEDVQQVQCDFVSFMSRAGITNWSMEHFLVDPSLIDLNGNAFISAFSGPSVKRLWQLFTFSKHVSRYPHGVYSVDDSLTNSVFDCEIRYFKANTPELVLVRTEKCKKKPWDMGFDKARRKMVATLYFQGGLEFNIDDCKNESINRLAGVGLCRLIQASVGTLAAGGIRRKSLQDTSGCQAWRLSPRDDVDSAKEYRPHVSVHNGRRLNLKRQAPMYILSEYAAKLTGITCVEAGGFIVSVHNRKNLFDFESDLRYRIDSSFVEIHCSRKKSRGRAVFREEMETYLKDPLGVVETWKKGEVVVSLTSRTSGGGKFCGTYKIDIYLVKVCVKIQLCGDSNAMRRANDRLKEMQDPAEFVLRTLRLRSGVCD